MRTSISTTSGSCVRAAASACVAVGRLADDRDVRLGVEHHPQSLADELLVVGDDDLDHALSGSGSRAWTAKPPSGRGTACEFAAEQRDALAHADEPVARPGSSALRLPAPSSTTSIVRASGWRRIRTMRARGARVLEGVRQRLLDDAVDGEVDRRRQIVVIAVDAELDPDARGSHAGGERLELRDPGLRRERRRVVVVVAEHAQQPAHLDQRLAAAVLDLLERAARRVVALARGRRRPEGRRR